MRGTLRVLARFDDDDDSLESPASVAYSPCDRLRRPL